MIKRNKWRLLISSIIILLPIFAGLILWNKLPEMLITHWGADGNPDGFMGRGLAVFFMPLFLLAMQWICTWITSRDPKNQDQNGKVFGLVLWICPILSLTVNSIMYAVSLGVKLRIETVMLLFLGVMFFAIGNYLPKCKQNFTIGIKIKWTLANEENWNATHRFGGRIWVVGGILLILCAWLPITIFPWVFIPAVLLLAVLPTLYSYRYYKKQVKEGKAPEKAVVPMSRTGKIVMWVVLGIVWVMLAVILFICYTGDLTPHYGETEFTLEASYFADLTVDYTSIVRADFRKTDDAGSRTNGFGSYRLSMGRFENAEHGTYTRYTYTQCPAAVILELSDGRIVVVNGETEADTLAIYEELSGRIGA